MNEKHVSVSQLGRYRRCGKQDELYMIHGPQAPGIAQTRGRVVHEVTADNMRAKRDDHALFPVEKIRDLTATKFEGAVSADGVRFTDQEHADGEAKALGEAKDFSVLAAVLHAEQAAPWIEPANVELEIRSEDPLEELDGHHLMGILDLTDSSKRVRDTKSTTNAGMVSQRTADTSPQLSVYALLFFMHTGQLPTGVVLDGLVVGEPRKDLSRNIKYVPAVSDRAWHQVRSTIETLGTLVKARNAGIFMPVDASGPGGWVCTRKWCGYTDVCPHYRKERERSDER